MRGPGPWALLANGGSLVLLGVLFHRPWADAWRWPTAEVAALGGPPRVPWSLLVAAGAVAALGVIAVGWARGRGPAFRGYRLLPIVAVVAAFVDLFALSPELWPPGALERGARALGALGARAQALASQERALPSADALRPHLAELGEAPYRVRGEPARGFTLERREGCRGPAVEPAGAKPGTLLYCVAESGQQGWLTLVGLPAEIHHGEPAVLSEGGRVVAVELAPSEPPPEPTPPAPPRDGGVSPR